MLITACIYHFLVRNRLLGDKYTRKHRGKEVQQHQVLFKMILFLFRSNGYIRIVRKIPLKKSDVETSLLAQWFKTVLFQYSGCGFDLWLGN